MDVSQVWMNFSLKKMALHSDNQFISNLRQYFTDTDVDNFVYYCNQPEQNTNINKRTGRVIIGVPSTKPKRILSQGSIKNYKSIILKFAKFKVDMVGRDSPITEEVAKAYHTNMISDDKMQYQTILTNVRVLNKHIFIPLLDSELQKPPIEDDSLNHKPQLMHDTVINTLKHIWNNCKNRDHAYKMILIYYSGLRSNEANNLTYRDILNSIGAEHIILRVRVGKHNKKRNVYILKGSPSNFFRNELIDYLQTKMIMKLTKCGDNNIEKYLDDKIFSNSSYQSAQKEFRKALKVMINTDEFPIKGAGLHSIRSDYSTRMLELIYRKCKNHRVALKLVGSLLGHSNDSIVDKHYVNLGFVNRCGYIRSEEERLGYVNNVRTNEEQSQQPQQNNNNIFTDLVWGGTVTDVIQNNNRVLNHNDIRNMFDIYDDTYSITI